MDFWRIDWNPISEKKMIVKPFCLLPTVYLLPRPNSLLCLPQLHHLPHLQEVLAVHTLLLLHINSKQQLSIWFEKKRKLMKIEWKTRWKSVQMWNFNQLMCASLRLHCQALNCIVLHYTPPTALHYNLMHFCAASCRLCLHLPNFMIWPGFCRPLDYHHHLVGRKRDGALQSEFRCKFRS